MTRELIQNADVVLVMQKSHRDYILSEYPEAGPKVFILSEFYGGEHKRDFAYGIPDPIGMGGEFYRNVKTVIRQSLEGVLNKISQDKPKS